MPEIDVPPSQPRGGSCCRLTSNRIRHSHCSGTRASLLENVCGFHVRSSQSQGLYDKNAGLKQHWGEDKFPSVSCVNVSPSLSLPANLLLKVSLCYKWQLRWPLNWYNSCWTKGPIGNAIGETDLYNATFEILHFHKQILLCPLYQLVLGQCKTDFKFPL